MKKEIPTHDPYTGELNPYYEELTGKQNPLKDVTVTITTNNFKQVCKELSDRLLDLPYENGDVSDIGNEIGIIISKYLNDDFGWEEKSFLFGLDCGIKNNKDGKHNIKH